MNMTNVFASCVYWLGDSALQVDARQLESLLGKKAGEIAPGLLASAIAQQGWAGVVDVVPAYDMVTIHFPPGAASAVRTAVEAWLPQAELRSIQFCNQIDIPVCYEEQLAPDLKEVARVHGLSCEEVVALHSAPLYEVVMLGFMPGFPYLEGLDARLATPRLASPRLSVPAGSVGIGGNQTGIYPAASPGGWRLIGRTPLSLFNPAMCPPCLLSPGARIRFVPISLDQYRDMLQTMPGAAPMPTRQELAALS